MRTGALTVNAMKSAPWPPLMFVNGAFGSFGSTLTNARMREGVVVLVAEQEQLGLVAVDGEVVVADAAEQRRALADAVAQEAARDLGGLEVVLLGEAVVRVRLVAERLEHLADLEGVVAGITERPSNGARLSSSTKVSSPSRPKTWMAPLMSPS